jgi:hypothetical protein
MCRKIKSYVSLFQNAVVYGISLFYNYTEELSAFFTNILYLDLLRWSIPESIERFIEGQAFLQSYDSAPHPLPPFSCQKAGPATQRKTDKESRFTDVKGGGGVDPNHTTTRKLVPPWIVQSSLYMGTNGIKVCIFSKKMHGGRTVNINFICELTRTCVCNFLHRTAIIVYPMDRLMKFLSVK